MADDARDAPQAARDDATPSPISTDSFNVTVGADGASVPPLAGAWRWVGDPELLRGLGVAEGAPVDDVAYRRVAGGLHAETGEVVRKPNTVAVDSGHARGLVHARGTFRVDAALAPWREAGPAERGSLSAELVAETEALIAQASGSERFVAAASVAEVGAGDDATIAVDWVALGADRGKGLVTANDGRARKAIEPYGRAAAGRVGERLTARQAERAATQTELSLPAPVAPDPELPSAPLRDSLTTNRRALGDPAMTWIRDRAASDAAGLDQVPEAELGERLPEDDPFAKLPQSRRRYPKALSAWYRANADEVVATVAVEEQLIDRARAGYAALAKRESERRGTTLPDPLAAVREARGEKFAAKVDRRAAVLASRLDSMSGRDRQTRTAELREEIRGVGLGQARFEAIAETVALQHSRNLENEEKAREIAPAADREIAAAPDIGADRG